MGKLSDLVGKQLMRVDAVHDYWQLRFSDGYTLNVFNPMTGLPGVEAARAIIAVRETADEIAIELSDGSQISIDMSPGAWTGPEALVLYAGDRTIAIWS